jgi:hypothetical protein
MLVLRKRGKNDQIPRPTPLPHRHAGGSQSRGVGRKESGGSEGPAGESKMGKQAATVPGAFRCWEVRGRTTGRRRGPCIQDGWLSSMGGGRGGEAARYVTFPPCYPFLLCPHHFLRGTHTPRMAHSEGWGRRISYVWASTQGRQPVSFVIVHIPLRGEWTLYENETNKQTILHPEGVWGLLKPKETGRRPCMQATRKDIPRSQHALCANLGVWVPLSKLKKEIWKRKETKRGLDGDVLQARAAPNPLLLCLPYQTKYKGAAEKKKKENNYTRRGFFIGRQPINFCRTAISRSDSLRLENFLENPKSIILTLDPS